MEFLYYRWRLMRQEQCAHQSHRLGLPCLRTAVYDLYCPKHYDSCEPRCENG